MLDRPKAIIQHLSTAHDGPGWYYWDEDYQDEGIIGAFSAQELAEQHAQDAGYATEVRL